MIPRDAGETLKKLSKDYPVLVITGPRQSGKTTLVKSIFSDREYLSFENPDVREMAISDPRGFLNRYRDGAVFDEIQRAPDLLSYMQQIIDENIRPGMFILTGSQQFGLISGITQSLAGRSALVRLLPFTLREWYGKNINVPIDQVLYSGLYPPIHDRKLDPNLWYANYINTYIERDVRQLVNVRDLNTFQRFVRLCAGRTGNLVNLSDLASDCGITHNTAKSWLSILEASYIIFLLSPYHKNFNKRIITTPKLYFYDTGLACWLLSIQNDEQVNTHPMRGPLFESLIISEYFKSSFNKGLPGFYYFWRDRSG
ncbi:MAG: ATP-binding protein, partial [Spirochaetota bacterium]